ncbi:MAG TPA: 50S ribosomal protein L20 [Armatimonadota bacterium]|nr:50S ribosomal protein L20 [Armatimonadota bacterium]
MPRVKRGIMTRKRHNRILQRAKGYWGARHRWYTQAHEAVMHAGQYAYRDRRVRKRDFRKLWIARINAACRAQGVSYSRFINGLSRAGIKVDRKVMADLAVNDPAGFTVLVQQASQALGA